MRVHAEHAMQGYANQKVINRYTETEIKSTKQKRKIYIYIITTR